MRRALLSGLLALFAATAPAHASQLVTWTTTSRYVDPAQQDFNGPPRPKALRVNVLLPDGYTPRKRWPVLYLLHGHGDAYDSWANPKNGDVAGVAKGFPGIIVMPEGDGGSISVVGGESIVVTEATEHADAAYEFAEFTQSEQFQLAMAKVGQMTVVPEFADQPKVINGCSDLFVAVLGERGRHARSAVGMGSLPGNITVEIEAILRIHE